MKEYIKNLLVSVVRITALIYALAAGFITIYTYKNLSVLFIIGIWLPVVLVFFAPFCRKIAQSFVGLSLTLLAIGVIEIVHDGKEDGVYAWVLLIAVVVIKGLVVLIDKVEKLINSNLEGASREWADGEWDGSEWDDDFPTSHSDPFYFATYEYYEDLEYGSWFSDDANVSMFYDNS